VVAGDYPTNRWVAVAAQGASAAVVAVATALEATVGAVAAAWGAQEVPGERAVVAVEVVVEVVVVTVVVAAGADAKNYSDRAL
jgi:hypothetical protein